MGFGKYGSLYQHITVRHVVAVDSVGWRHLAAVVVSVKQRA